ncbi:hypothetical protein C0J52_26513 [Blattella germanica]|nr:hypothetical protein C0J52_26513 [Blattella germanica]
MVNMVTIIDDDDVELWNNSTSTGTSAISCDNSSDVIQELLNQNYYLGTSSLFSCPQCRKSYRSKYSLRRHIAVECGKEPQFTCPHCHRKIKHKHDLVVHMKLYCKVLRLRNVGTYLQQRNT